MESEGKSFRKLIREFFGYYPDYALCRTLALNIESNVTTYHKAVEILTKKAWARHQNRESIVEKLDLYAVSVAGQSTRIKDLSLRQIMDLEDPRALEEILGFYFKHPYAHRRTRKSRLLPRWIRTFFLSSLVGHAKGRGVYFDYSEYFELLRLL